MKAADSIRRLIHEGRVQEARKAGEDAIAADPHDDDAVKALIEVYLYIEKRCIDDGVTSYLDRLERRIGELIAMITGCDKLSQQHRQQRMALKPGYAMLKELEELSARDGNEQEAYRRARAMYDNKEIVAGLHEIYGTILYRYARVTMSDDDSRPFRALMLDYLGLTVQRPSRLHSLILRLAVRAARRYPDFDFVRFFELWNPRFLRPEDIVDSDDKAGLASCALEIVMDSSRPDMLSEFLDMLSADAETKLDIMREVFDRLVTRHIKGGDNLRAIDLLELYGKHSSLHRPCPRHSRLLGSALKVMRDDDEWRFVSFFVNWDTRCFLPADMEPVIAHDGAPIEPLASRALKRCFEAVKSNSERHSPLLGRVLLAFERALPLQSHVSQELTVRRIAMILRLMDRSDDAFERMSAMARDGVRSARFWLDFADLATTSRLKLGILALGTLELMNNRSTSVPAAENSRLKLALAVALNREGYVEHAAGELDDYDNETRQAAAEPLPAYGPIRAAIPTDVVPHHDNEILYHRLAAIALETIYSTVPSVIMTVVGYDDNSLVVACSDKPAYIIDTIMWPALADSRPGDCIEVKRNEAQGIVLARQFAAEPYSYLDSGCGVVSSHDVICPARGIFRVKANTTIPPGTIVVYRQYLDYNSTITAVNIHSTSLKDVLPRFESLVAAVYGTTDTATLFSCGPGGDCGEFQAAMCSGLSLGDVCEIHYYLDEQHALRVVNVARLNDDTSCEGLKIVSGRLCRDADGEWTVRDTSVPGDLVSRRQVDDGVYVACKAVYCPVTPPVWLAIDLSTYD